MALLRRRLTRDELREAWNTRAAHMSNEQLVLNFGDPPYWFLGQNAGGNPAPTYAQFHGLLVDHRLREYAPVGPSDPQAAFVRLPRAVTAAQNTMAGLMATPMDERMDFPRVGETVVLAGMGTEDSPDHVWRRTVAQVDNWAGVATGQRVATARLVFTRPLPERCEIETSAQTRSRDAALERAQTPRSAMLRPAAGPPPPRGFAGRAQSSATQPPPDAAAAPSKRASASSLPPTKRSAY